MTKRRARNSTMDAGFCPVSAAQAKMGAKFLRFFAITAGMKIVIILGVSARALIALHTVGRGGGVMKRFEIKAHSWNILIGIAALTLLLPLSALGHCDSIDGPVVKAAQNALAARNVNFVLVWIQKENESEINEAFKQTLKVRRLGRDARALADKYFFETVVRLHRAGEGEAYTGLKPAGTNIVPIIRVLDKAIDTGSAAQLLNEIPAPAKADVEEQFKQVIRLKKYNINNVEAGRRYVKSYVTFIHHVEELYEASHTS